MKDKKRSKASEKRHGFANSTIQRELKGILALYREALSSGGEGNKREFNKLPSISKEKSPPPIPQDDPAARGRDINIKRQTCGKAGQKTFTQASEKIPLCSDLPSKLVPCIPKQKLPTSQIELYIQPVFSSKTLLFNFLKPDWSGAPMFFWTMFFISI
ncbi:MAG: hypothetical protein G3M78_09220 [Candidatus Nitrohelix vancouverensis]|uniref:Uncharacterized protein n=1 Tax=Candidatus Nitrohelix vancouverensis TaxID=2705534 RepID=A0A7T0C2W3_9BACT|nr:MAG: hypothetical protein G3M78_09220 [Candidatus Nitrohelix vancouverensis]